jgi:hypothetical protein
MGLLSRINMIFSSYNYCKTWSHVSLVVMKNIHMNKSNFHNKGELIGGLYYIHL